MQCALRLCVQVFVRTALSMRKQPAVAFLKMAHDGQVRRE
jgi:hypothetical protein